MISAALALAASLAAAEAPPEAITARVALVMDIDSEEVLYEQGDTTAPHAIASITKLLALRVIMRQGFDLEGETTMIRSDFQLTAGGARSRLITGRAYRNLDLLHAALLGSDNRAVLALGRAAGLDFDALVRAMNREVEALGMKFTHFEDPTGIDHGNYASAREVVGMLEAALALPLLARTTRVREWTASAQERSGRPLLYRNTNLLAHDEDRTVLVGKTGFNSAAGWCVATVVQLPSTRRVAVVVLGTRTKYMRFRDARRLARWAATLPWEPPERPPLELTP